MNRKALFFDIDGTLLEDTTKRMPESAVRAIHAARENGHLVFINSGRARCLMQEVEEKLSVDGYLCGCGTYIEVRGQVALRHLISEKRRREIQENILSHGLDGILEGTGGCYVHRGVPHIGAIENVKEVVTSTGTLYDADWLKETVPFDKFCILADENSDLRGFLEFLKPDISAIDRGGGLYECVPTGFDKATAMEFILNYFGIPWEESYAFGDSSNDLAMIRYACNSVIMGQHHEVLEPYATFVTKNVEDDGIAYAMEQLKIVEP